MPKNNAREQIISQLKESENILIALSNNPSVDELASALALTLAINKTGKHATAVASGKMPDVLEFLNPAKTFQTSVNSLRDFIIALNKEKADHLRYKLVGDHVKIFITPYKTTITKSDLEFEQGDFNVDFVLALGVDNQENLDGALAAHGRIFHDAAVGVLSVGENPSNLSEMNWHEELASSLSEMALELIESDSIGKKSLNKAVATAILTGIISETERFSNEKTNAKVMNIASKLIMAGADQQLVISKIRESEEKAIQPENTSLKVEKESEEQVEEATEAPKDASLLTIEREETPDDEAENAPVETSEQTNQINEELEKIKELAADFPATQEIQPETAPIDFEETPIAEVPTEPQAPAVEPAELPQVVAPVENIQNEIPAPEANFEQNTAFVAEQPIASETFTPAEQTPAEEPAPASAIKQTKSKILTAEQPTFGARDYASNDDDYYHPESNQNLAEALAQNGEILSHEPQSTAELPAVPDFNNMPLPPELPPVPDFNNLNAGEIPLPAPLPEIPQPAEPPVPEVAQGTNASTNNIMTDQIYQDPSQFQIPGM
ncbi:MAG: hypothetical protein Q4A27_01655 [bacterium]|nr:hypothetical protein [bacterium]